MAIPETGREAHQWFAGLQLRRTAADELNMWSRSRGGNLNIGNFLWLAKAVPVFVHPCSGGAQRRTS